MRYQLTSCGRHVGRVLLGLSAVWLVVAAVPAAAQTAADRPVTFTKDIAPILQKSCQQCHRPDSIAPMSLLTYEQVRPYARAIKQRTQLAYVLGNRGAMPPWFFERNIGIQQLKDDMRLSDAEIATLAKWADSGAPEGNPADMPPPITFLDNSRWFIGTPDLIVPSPAVTVKATAPDWWGDIGETPSGQDIIVNIGKEKRLSNVRASGSDEAIRLIPPLNMTLDMALEYIQEDELVEVTPKSIRLRKKILDEVARKRDTRAKADKK